MGLNDPTQRLPAVPPHRPESPADDATTVLPVVRPDQAAASPPRRPPATLPGLTVPPTPTPAPTAAAPPPTAAPSGPAGDRPVPGPVKMLETIAGLLSSGLLVLTVVLLGAVVVAPLVVDGATGPQWWRIGVGAAVAVPGELIRIGRRGRALWLRGTLAAVVVIAVVGTLALTWWW